jgi:hypothetical protein
MDTAFQPGDLLRFDSEPGEKMAVMPLKLGVINPLEDWWHVAHEEVVIFIGPTMTSSGADASIIYTARGIGWVYTDELCHA